MNDATRQAIIETVMLDRNVEAPTIAREIGDALASAAATEREWRIVLSRRHAEEARHRDCLRTIEQDERSLRRRCRHAATTLYRGAIYMESHRACDVCGAELPSCGQD